MSAFRDAAEHIEVRWEGLARAAWVIDRHGNIAAGCQTECHCHAVVVVCVDGHAALQATYWRRDDAIIPAFLHLGLHGTL